MNPLLICSVCARYVRATVPRERPGLLLLPRYHKANGDWCHGAYRTGRKAPKGAR